MVAHVSCSVVGARKRDSEVTAFTPSAVQEQQAAGKKRDHRNSEQNNWTWANHTWTQLYIYDDTQKKKNITVKMINPWKEIHLICKDEVHKTSFPQWALIPDTDATQVRKPPTGKHKNHRANTHIQNSKQR